MKIIRLEITNITSFVGNHVINFKNLTDTENLFAITGPTGSGKSSIITAISLALYGRGHKRSLNSADYVSQGAMFATIFLEFQQNCKIYKATWYCKIRKKNGDYVKTPSLRRELFVNNVATEKSIEEIIGLSYEQFCKTAILNQGEFAKFITSSFRERKDILEKMYDDDTLSKISIILIKKIKLLQEDNERLHVKEKNSLPYTYEQIDEIRSNIKNDSDIFENIKLYNENLKTTLLALTKQQEIRKKIIHFKEKESSLSTILRATRNRYNNSMIQLSKEKERYTSFQKEFKKIYPILNLAIKTEERAKNIQTLIKSKNEQFTDYKVKFEEKKQSIRMIQDMLNKKELEREEILKETTTPFNQLQQIPFIKDTADNLSTIINNNNVIIQSQNNLNHNFNEIKKELFSCLKESGSIEEKLNKIAEITESNLDMPSFENYSILLSCLEKQKNAIQKEGQFLSQELIHLNKNQSLISTAEDKIKMLDDDEKRTIKIKEKTLSQLELMNENKKMLTDIIDGNRISSMKHELRIVSKKNNLCLLCEREWSHRPKTNLNPTRNQMDTDTMGKDIAKKNKLETNVHKLEEELIILAEKLNYIKVTKNQTDEDILIWHQEDKKTKQLINENISPSNTVVQKDMSSLVERELEQNEDKITIISSYQKEIIAGIESIRLNKQRINTLNKKQIKIEFELQKTNTLVEDNKKYIESLTAKVRKTFVRYNKDPFSLTKDFKYDETILQKINISSSV